MGAMDGKGPDHLRPGQVGRTARSRIRPFPLCIIALSRNASCLHLLFNCSKSAFFGQGQQRLVRWRQRLFVEATASPQIWIPCLPSPRRRCNSWSSPLAHQSRDMSAHHFALNAQALFILFWCIRRHVLDCGTTERATRFGTSDESVGLDLWCAEFLQVTLDVIFVVIRVSRIVQASTARCFEIVDPSKALRADKLIVQSEPLDMKLA